MDAELLEVNCMEWFDYQKDISGCGLFGVISKKKKMINGSVPQKAIANMHDRGNGLGGGFAAYGIYPDYAEYYALHIMFDSVGEIEETERFLEENLDIEHLEEIPTRANKNIGWSPYLRRYFVKPVGKPKARFLETFTNSDDDYIVQLVMYINDKIEGTYVFSSGKNMGAFKGVGFPEDIADFFKLDEYEGYIWTAHNRFPTNTQGWWGGAHPFTLLDWSIVHNGEISSYGINRRYLEMFGYKLSLHTDTEVVAYLMDLVVRKHGLSYEVAAKVFAPDFWKDIDDNPDQEEKEALTALRTIYGPAILNGPFAILFAFHNGVMGLNDRVKLRPLIVGEKDDFVYFSSEEAGIREVEPDLDRVYAPPAGEPVLVFLEENS